MLLPTRGVPNRFALRYPPHMTPASEHGQGAPYQVEISLREIGQLFNTMDPSPFHERDLDHDAEEFIESWVREVPLKEPVSLVIRLNQTPAGSQASEEVQTAVRNYFAYRAKVTALELRRLLKDGRLSLLIGSLFLCTCLIVGDMLAKGLPASAAGIVREGLTIIGWVAMWHPLEVFLYEWWPIWRLGRVYQKMGRMPVEVRLAG